MFSITTKVYQFVNNQRHCFSKLLQADFHCFQPRPHVPRRNHLEKMVFLGRLAVISHRLKTPLERGQFTLL